MSLRDIMLSSYVAYSNNPPLLAAGISWGALLLSQIACFWLLCSVLRLERRRCRPRIGHVPLLHTMLASCTFSCAAVCVLYGSVWLTPKGSETPTSASPTTESKASAFQRMAAEALFASYACLQMFAFIGFAASKMVTLLLLFTITIGLEWDQFFILRAHTLLKRVLAALSLLLLACTAFFVYFHVKSVATRIRLDHDGALNGTHLQLRDDYHNACLSEGVLLLSQAAFLSLILFGLAAAILKVKPVTYRCPDSMRQPMLGMTETWSALPIVTLFPPHLAFFPHRLFNSRFGRRIAACVLALIFLLVGRSTLSALLGAGVLTMRDSCGDGSDILQVAAIGSMLD
jgi:hypothetical protein